jgi:predicted RNase H-like nuclease/ppGpp synthetase/RelA/SpoT-type nucleotidyltranferase
VHHIGLDLAWGERRPTGVAVLDPDGRLLHVSSVLTDDEIVETLEAYDGPCLVGIDAPLVVTNETGNREAERELNRDFRAYEAGAHPTNLSKPEFRDGPRGGLVAKRLGLDLNPRSGRERRGVEVYPHAATVALFRLPRTLKYKNKPGRDLDSLQRELLTLVRLLESSPDLDLDTPAWTALREAVEAAGRKSELRVAEDQVDAVVCALVARVADLRPEAMTTYGSLEDGYILTPSLPVDLAAGPAAGSAAGVADPVQTATTAYAAMRTELETAGAEAVALVTAILDEAGIDYVSVTGRVKSIASFAEKASRTADGRLLYPDPLRDVTDQLGVRVVTYVAEDVEAVAGLLDAQLVVSGDRDLGEETASQGRYGYSSRHLLLTVDPARADRFPGLRERPVSVQVRTMLQHAWAEFEHDIRYKGTVPEEHASEFDRRFTLAAGLLELADREFTAIRARLRPDVPREGAEDDDPRIDPRELAAFLAGWYADAGWSRTDHYAWISGLLLELGVTSLDELADVLGPTDDLDLNTRMGYRYPPGAVRRLDDALLAAYGSRFVDLVGNAHRRPLLTERLERLRG